MEPPQMDLQQPNFRSTYYYIAQLSVDCRLCGATTRVVALILPDGHEALDEPDEQGSQPWQAFAGKALLFYIDQLPAGAAANLCRLAPGFGQVAGDETQSSLWANHCEHCDALLNDDELHCEPGDSFVPDTEAQGADVRLFKIDEALEASAGGCSMDPEFLSFGKRR
jgi:hypothetical protein